MEWEGRGGGGVHEKSIYRGELPKKRGLDSFQIKGGLEKKEGVVFLRGINISMHTIGGAGRILEVLSEHTF